MKKKLERTAKGRRPEYFDNPAVDRLHAMVLTLVEELWVTRERQKTLENILQANGIDLTDAFDSYTSDEDEIKHRAQERQEYLQRIFRVILDDARRRDPEYQARDRDAILQLLSRPD